MIEFIIWNSIYAAYGVLISGGFSVTRFITLDLLYMLSGGQSYMVYIWVNHMLFASNSV